MADISDNIDQAGLADVLDTLVDDVTAINWMFAGLLTGSATRDASSIADGDEEVKEVTVTGAALWDFVLVSASIDVADLALVAQVTATDTVTCQLLNNTGGAIDLWSMTVRVVVLPFGDLTAPWAITTTK